MKRILCQFFLSKHVYLQGGRAHDFTCGRLNPFRKVQDPFRKRVCKETGGKIPPADFCAKPYPHAKSIA